MEILELLQQSVRDFGQTTRHGHARPACGSHRRPGAVPRRRPDRQGSRVRYRARGPRGDGRARRPNAPRSATGAAGAQAARRPDGVRHRARCRDGQRHAVLTNAIDSAFDRSSRSVREHRRGGQAGRLQLPGRDAEPSRCRRRCSRDPRAPGTAEAVGTSRTTRRPRSSTATARRSTPAALPRSGLASTRARSTPSSTRSKLVEGRWATDGDEVVIGVNTADDENFKLGDEVSVASLHPVRKFTLVGIARYGDVDSVGGATFAVFTTPTAQELFDARTPTTASGRGEGGHDRRRARLGDQADPAVGRPGAHRGGGGEETATRSRRSQVHPLLPARIRRRGALRRRVRHLQHALDHDRAAHARVRNPADDRRVAAAGARLRDCRGARRRRARVDRRTLPWAAHGARDQVAGRARGHRPTAWLPLPAQSSRGSSSASA